MQSLWDAQVKIEKAWPFPGKTNVNISIRDVFATLLVLLAFLVAKYFGPKGFGVFAFLCVMEPAIVAFPFNVAQSLVLRTPRFWDPLKVEPQLKLLQDSFSDLRAEALQVLKSGGGTPFSQVSVHQRRIAGGQPWKVFPFFSYGTRNNENCAQCPLTSKLLEKIPSIRLAMYSIMEEGTEIKVHCGFFKSVLRVHLTLAVDQEDTEQKRFIEVGGQRHSWKSGEMICFDDTYPHRVSNKVPGRRLVLFLDVDRPYEWESSKALSKLLLWVMQQSPSVKEHANLQEKSVQT